MCTWKSVFVYSCICEQLYKGRDVCTWSSVCAYNCVCIQSYLAASQVCAQLCMYTVVYICIDSHVWVWTVMYHSSNAISKKCMLDDFRLM